MKKILKKFFALIIPTLIALGLYSIVNRVKYDNKILVAFVAGIIAAYIIQFVNEQFKDKA